MNFKMKPKVEPKAEKKKKLPEVRRRNEK